MSSTLIGLIATVCLFGGALLGVWLRIRLPSHHLDKDSQEVVKICGGIVATITALVLGLLVSSAKGTFDTVNDGVKQGCAKIILLDRSLAQYGPEAQALRAQLKQMVVGGTAASKSRKPAGAPDAAAAQPTGRAETVQGLLRGMTPQTDSQRQLLAQAQQLAGDLAQSRWLLMEEEQSELPAPLLIILISWLTVLFVSFGLFAPRNATVLIALFVSACSMSAAIFLILELNRPTEGCIKVSGAPVRSLIQQLGR